MAATLLKAPSSEFDPRPRVSPGTPANENRLGGEVVRAAADYWPLAAIGFGILASIAWCSALLFGAFLLTSWIIR